MPAFGLEPLILAHVSLHRHVKRILLRLFRARRIRLINTVKGQDRRKDMPPSQLVQSRAPVHRSDRPALSRLPGLAPITAPQRARDFFCWRPENDSSRAYADEAAQLKSVLPRTVLAAGGRARRFFSQILRTGVYISASANACSIRWFSQGPIAMETFVENGAPPFLPQPQGAPALGSCGGGAPSCLS